MTTTNIWWRRSLVAIAVIAFFVISIGAVGFTFGFQYDQTTHRIVRTGLLAIKVKPTDATVTVNGKVYENNFNFSGLDRIRNLKPGTASVAISKDGYQTWSKKLEIRPDVVTWEKYVRLFLSTPEKTTITEKTAVLAWALSPDERQLASVSKDASGSLHATITDLASKKVTELVLPEATAEVSWHLTNKQPMWNTASDRVAFATEKKTTETTTGIAPLRRVSVNDLTTPDMALWHIDAPRDALLLSSLGVAPKQVEWSLTNRNTLYLINDAIPPTLVSLQVADKKLSEPIAAYTTSFDQNKSGLWYLGIGSTGKLGLTQQTTSEFTEVSGLPADETLQLSVSPTEHFAVVYANESHTLYAIRGTEARLIKKDVAPGYWSLDVDEESETSENFLYTDAHTVYFYDPVIANSEILASFTDEVYQADWLRENYQYVLVTLGNPARLVAVELDEQDGRQQHTLYTYANQAGIHLPLLERNDAKSLLINDTAGDNLGVVSLQIR